MRTSLLLAVLLEVSRSTLPIETRRAFAAKRQQQAGEARARRVCAAAWRGSSSRHTSRVKCYCTYYVLHAVTVGSGVGAYLRGTRTGGGRRGRWRGDQKVLGESGGLTEERGGVGGHV